MNPIDKITEAEKTAIANYIRVYAVGDASPASHMADISHILRFWNEKKADLFSLFGENLILSRPVEYRLDTYQIAREIDQKCMRMGQSGTILLNTMFKTMMYTENLHSLTHDEWEDLYYGHFVSTEELAKNIYSGNTVIFTINNETIRLDKGCKLMKAIQKVAAPLGLMKEFEAFRIDHSMCLNQKVFSGEMCLSIHPLDYMTMSDNDNNWQSCMNWRHEGDYRQGTVEMMNSPCVVVAYLKSKTDMIIPGGFDWNNKKWRQLFIIEKNLIVEVKSYPFKNTTLTNIALDWLRDLAIERWGVTYLDKKVEFVNASDDEFTEIPALDSKVWFYFETEHMYCDIYEIHLGYANCNILDACEKDWQHRYRYVVKYSGCSECMWCGEALGYDDIEDSSCLICPDCIHYNYCICCSRRIPADDEFEWIDDEPVCIDCIDNESGIFKCDYCGEYHLMHNRAKTVEIHYLDDRYWEIDNLQFCYDCDRAGGFNKKFGPIINAPSVFWGSRHKVNLEDMPIEGLEHIQEYKIRYLRTKQFLHDLIQVQKELNK